MYFDCMGEPQKSVYVETTIPSYSTAKPSMDIISANRQSSFENIVEIIKTNQIRLNSRANRTLLSDKNLCYLGIKDKERKKLLFNLVNDFENSDLLIDDGVLALSFSILKSSKLITTDWLFNKNSKLDAMLSKWAKEKTNLNAIKNFFSKYEIPNCNDDILGAFYQSVQSISQKSNFGSYYTPPELLNEIKIPSDKTILDPCCGSGGILLSILTKEHNSSKIFARDIDEIALKICFINLVLFFNNNNIVPNISKQDITLNGDNSLFFQPNNDKFDYIVTNPPWGSKFTAQQKEYLCRLYPNLATSETFSISLYNALKMLKDSGEFYFFLPHSFLNVATHRNIRHFIFNEKNEISIKLLGNAFKGVLSESILLHLKNSSAEKNVSVQDKGGNVYQIPLQNIASPDYIVSATSKTQDTLLIDKIYNTEHITLIEDAIFALGIVTGNNKKYLNEKKTAISEAIFRGKDIDKYIFSEPKYFIEFQPNLYQQVASEEYYRQKKIAYRFISDKIVCVLDKENSLLLNSANIFISKIYPMETIVSFFNSDIYTFIFRKKFHSRKVLKSHLQNLPLPILSYETHQFISNLYNETFSRKSKDTSSFQYEIDKIICKAFSIAKEQFNYIKGEL